MELTNKFSNVVEYKETFDTEVAKFLLELSNVSYEEKESKLKAELEGIGLTLKKYIEKDNQEAIISYNDDIILVSFPGTNVTEIEDVLVNLQFYTTTCDYGRINTGYYSSYKKLKFDVYRAILALDKEKSRPIYWAGHSLGGSVATIFATFYKKGTVYTFGAPKVGDEQFCRESDKLINHYRITNHKDIIPFLPPWVLGYKHSGNRIEYSITSDVDAAPKYWLDIITYILTGIIQIFSSSLSFVFSSAWWMHSRFKYHLTGFYKDLINKSSYTETPSPYKKKELTELEALSITPY